MCGGADDGYTDSCKYISPSEKQRERGVIICSGGMLRVGSTAVRMALAELKETMIIHDTHFPGVIVLDSCFDIRKEEHAAEETFPIHNRPQLCSNPKMLDRESNSKRCGYSTKFKK